MTQECVTARLTPPQQGFEFLTSAILNIHVRTC